MNWRGMKRLFAAAVVCAGGLVAGVAPVGLALAADAPQETVAAPAPQGEPVHDHAAMSSQQTPDATGGAGKGGANGPGMMGGANGPGMMGGPGYPGMMRGPGYPGMMRGPGYPGMMGGPNGPGMMGGPNGPGMMGGPNGPGMMGGPNGPGRMGGPNGTGQSCSMCAQKKQDGGQQKSCKMCSQHGPGMAGEAGKSCKMCSQQGPGMAGEAGKSCKMCGQQKMCAACGGMGAPQGMGMRMRDPILLGYHPVMVGQRLAFLKDLLAVTQAQEGAWKGYADAAMAVTTAHGEGDPGARPDSALAMAESRTRFVTQLTEKRQLAVTAFKELHAQLTDEQKAKLDQFFGGFAR
ncbi:MAG: Spy/CpxP family protein refolding chaperone [Magnetococcus sp. YQC-3]